MALTFFDTLGNRDFFLARKQINRTHFTHVHTHGISSATKFRIYCRQSRFGFFGGIFVSGSGCGITHNQRFSIWRDIAHRDTHIVDHAGNTFNLLDLDHVRQMIIDFGVSQITALFSENNQRLETTAARIGILYRQICYRSLNLGSQLLAYFFRAFFSRCHIFSNCVRPFSGRRKALHYTRTDHFLLTFAKVLTAMHPAAAGY